MSRRPLPEDHRINDYKHLLSRVEEKQLDALFDTCREEKNTVDEKQTVAAATISIDDFNKLDLRVARIARAERSRAPTSCSSSPSSSADGTRTVFAGIKSAYAPEKLEGRFAVVVANLAPRKMKFGVSEGMVLAASGGRDRGFFSFRPIAGPSPACA